MTDTTALAKRKKKSPEPNEGKEKLAAETTAGRRLRSVTIEDGALVLSGNDDAQKRVADSFGTESREFQTYCITQLINILPEGETEAHYTLAINSAVELLSAIAPRNALEAALAVQMVATNHLALLSTRRTIHAQTVEGRQMNANLATKFARTFTSQIEALDRHRRGGKQIVEHVHVNAGGQAVIAGTVNAGRAGG